MSVSDYQWRPYVSVAMRRRRAVQTIATLQRSGRVLSPVAIDGRTIARTFWGKSWCKNLEAYSDYANRLPRGRTYVRNGSVIDLRIDPGRVRALVSGSRMYDVEIEITRLARRRWKAITSQCAGQIGSMVELLQGSIARGVMEIVTRRGGGLFPAPRDISLSCSCPDWATMCKHVAAVLYGVGARLDQEPEMLFTLRDVAPAELIVAAVTDVSMTRKSGRRRLLQTEDMSSVFGIDLDRGCVGSRQSPAAHATTHEDLHQEGDHDPRGGRAQETGNSHHGHDEERIRHIDTQEDALVEEHTGRRQEDNAQDIGHGQGQREDTGGPESDCHEIKEDGVIARKRPNRKRKT